MGNITVNNASLFIMTEGGEPMPLSNAIEVEIIEECSKTDPDEIIGHMCASGEIEINYTPDYFNQKDITEVLFGMTNNCRRMHGGFALRERKRYQWYKRYGEKNVYSR